MLKRAVSGRFSPLRDLPLSALRSRCIVFCHARSTLRSAQFSARSAHMLCCQPALQIKCLLHL